MNKIIVIGCPGSGKSVFARQLHATTHIPLYHLDMIWHKPDKTTVSKEEFDSKLLDILQKDQWIIDGNFQRTIEQRIIAADTIFLLDFSTEVCLDGVRNRIGKSRPDMPWVEEELSKEFKESIVKFKYTKLPKIYELLKQHGDGKTIVVFKTRDELRAFLNTEVKNI